LTDFLEGVILVSLLWKCLCNLIKKYKNLIDLCFLFCYSKEALQKSNKGLFFEKSIFWIKLSNWKKSITKKN